MLAGRDRSGWVAREVDEVGQAPPDQWINLDAVDLAGPDGIAVAGVLHGHAGKRGRHQQLVSVEDGLDCVVNLAAGDLVCPHVRHAEPVTHLYPPPVLGWQVIGMIFHEVDPSRLQALESTDVQRHHEPRPDIAQLVLRPRDADLYFLDRGPRLLERRKSATHRRGDGMLDRKDVEVSAVGDLPALDGACRRRREVGLVEKTERIPRIRTGQDVQADRRILNGAGDGSFEDERRDALECVGPAGQRYPPKRGLVTVDTAPGGRDPDRASSVSAFREWNEAVRDCGRAAAGGAARVAGGVEGIT